MLERLADRKENEWQKLARGIGFDPTTTVSIFNEMLTTSGEERYMKRHYNIKLGLNREYFMNKKLKV